MARRRSLPGSVRGGGGIQAFRKIRTRIALGIASAAVYAGVLAYAVAREPKFAPAIGGVGAVGAIFLAFVLLGHSEALVPWAVAFLGAAYVLSLVARGGGGVDEGTPLVAAGLLAFAELAVWSRQERQSYRAARAIFVTRAIALLALVLGGLIAAALVVGVSAVPTGGGLAWTLVGAVAAVAILGVAVRLAQRTPLH